MSQNQISPTLKILLIEDNAADARLILEMLRDVHPVRFELTHKESFREGLLQLGERVFDILLLDLNLPDSRGLDSLSRILARFPRIPIVVLTGLSDEALGIGAVQQGAQDYLVKGEVESRLLVRALRYAIERKQIDLMKSDLISFVSHELSNPLSAVNEALVMMLERLCGELNLEQAKILLIAKDNVSRLMRIVTDYMNVSKLEVHKLELRLESVDICKVITEALNQMQIQAQIKQIELVVPQFPAPQIWIWADPERLNEILVNLICNAIKFTPEGGRVQIGVTKNGAQLEVLVIDTGVGIAKEDIPKIFSKFVQLGRPQEGTAKGMGLGLAITKGLVELHGGKIWVESHPGQGSKFIFTIPHKDK
jgi:signal transduction histidine kinase